MANENLDIDSKTAEELYEWYLDDKLIINRRYQISMVPRRENSTDFINDSAIPYPFAIVCFH